MKEIYSTFPPSGGIKSSALIDPLVSMHGGDSIYIKYSSSRG
jgi:hypothetical protein